MTEEENYKVSSLINLANIYRGQFLGIFIQVEAIMADMTINITKTTYERYYHKIKSADNIIEDFFNAFDTIKDNLPQQFKDYDNFKLEMNLLRKTRNVFAHGIVLTTKEEWENFDGSNIKLHSCSYGKCKTTAYSKEDMTNIHLKMQNTVQGLSLLQKKVHDFLKQ